jgi:hypothetical protein
VTSPAVTAAHSDATEAGAEALNALAAATNQLRAFREKFTAFAEVLQREPLRNPVLAAAKATSRSCLGGHQTSIDAINRAKAGAESAKGIVARLPALAAD